MQNLSRLNEDDYKYARKRFGGPIKAVLASLVLDMREMRKIEQQILQGTDETVMAFKSSHLDAVNMIAVASSINAQLSSTTLQMPGLSEVHWTAAGFVIAALLFGLMALLTACVQQQILGMLNSPEGVRMWLSNGHFYPPHHKCSPKYDKKGDEASKDCSCGKGGGDGDHDNEHNHHGRKSILRRRLQASVSSLQLLGLPHQFLALGIVCFLVGFGLNLAFAYKLDLEDTPAKDNNEAVLILFMTVAATALALGGGSFLWKIREINQAEKTLEQDIGNEDGGDDEDEEDKEEEEDGDQGKGSSKVDQREDEDGDEDEGESSGSGGSGRGDKDNKDYSGDEDEDDDTNDERTSLLNRKNSIHSENGSKRKSKPNDKETKTETEADRHDEIATALEDAAKAHRRIARLMKKQQQEKKKKKKK